jgi:hypothetical protein
VRVCGCRPRDGGAAHAGGPAYANLQRRKPREVWRGRASDAMGILASAVCRRGLLNACVGCDQGYDEPGWPVAIGRNDVGSARSNRATVIAGAVRSSLIIAGRDSAKQRCSPVILPRADLDHDVSILIPTVDAAGRVSTKSRPKRSKMLSGDTEGIFTVVSRLSATCLRIPNRLASPERIGECRG